MQKTLLIVKRNILSIIFLLFICTTISSCKDDTAYEMDLKFQRQITAQFLYDNSRILLSIEKEVQDNGSRIQDTVVRDHAINIIVQRNRAIDSIDRFLTLVKNNTELKESANGIDGSVELLDYYQKVLNDKHDSLSFQKLINIYLTFEKFVLNDDLMNVSSSCNWGRWNIVHVSKTSDTIRKNDTYELAVIPDTYDHNFSYVNDDCEITIYRNGKPEEIKHSILKKGSVFLISLNPTQSGNYEFKGSFTQRARVGSYVLNLKFVDAFVVND